MSEQNTAIMSWRKLIDLATYVTYLSGGTFVVAFFFTLVFGVGLSLVVHITFIVGFLMFGYATYLLWPRRPWETKMTDDRVTVVNTEPDEVDRSRTETAVQSAIQQLPPLNSYSLPPSERLSPGMKLFITSLTVLLGSFAIESIFIL